MSVDQVRDQCRLVGELHAAGRFAEASTLAASTVSLCRDSVGPAHYAWPLTLCASAACHVAMGDRPGAILALEEAVRRAQALQSWDFEHARSTLAHTARLYSELGEAHLARQLWLELIQITGQELGEDHPRYFAERARLASEFGEAQTPSKART